MGGANIMELQKIKILPIGVKYLKKKKKKKIKKPKLIFIGKSKY